jgi:DNA-binding transcriptional LysR family regulator
MQLSEALLATGRFVTLLPRSVISFSGKRLPIKVLPIKLPVSPPPVGITRLKNRTVSPVAQLFMDCAHTLAKPLRRFSDHS